jgi:hypothetical protein
MELNESGREQLALALILLKDFKCQGRFDNIEVSLMVIELARYIGVYKEFDKLLTKLPPFKIEVKHD